MDTQSTDQAPPTQDHAIALRQRDVILQSEMTQTILKAIEEKDYVSTRKFDPLLRGMGDYSIAIQMLEIWAERDDGLWDEGRKNDHLEAAEHRTGRARSTIYAMLNNITYLKNLGFGNVDILNAGTYCGVRGLRTMRLKALTKEQVIYVVNNAQQQQLQSKDIEEMIIDLSESEEQPGPINNNDNRDYASVKFFVPVETKDRLEELLNLIGEEHNIKSPAHRLRFLISAYPKLRILAGDNFRAEEIDV